MDADVEALEMQSDQLRLSQILKNLLANAIKFTSEGKVELNVAVQASDIVFKVVDTGIGVEKENLKKIFSEFQQADGSTSRKFGGTGLGLSISRKLAQLLGGDIDLASELGKGSTFTLSIPFGQSIENLDDNDVEVIQQEKEKPASKSKPENRPIISQDIPDDRENFTSSAPSLLVIDDDPTFCKSIYKLAKQGGYQCLLATSGKTGIELAIAYQPSGIILDLGLPDISGDEVLSRLKKDTKTIRIPIHIISGRDKDEGIVQQGALSFIQKPVSQDQVITLLSKISENAQNNILIVEDDVVIQKGLSDLFDSLENVHIDFAENLKSALASYKKLPYTCVVVDLGLPDGNGLDFLEEISGMSDKTPAMVVYTARDLTPEEHKRVKQYTDSVIVKGERAHERLFDEIMLFIHHVDETEDRPKDIKPKDVSFDGKVILLVDDDLRNTFALSRALEQEGLSVIIADNGELALEKLSEHPEVDMVLMDMMMPVMDGFEAITKIRATDSISNLPIISLTARATQQDREACMNAGADDYMSKPVNVQSLVELIKLWLSKSRG